MPGKIITQSNISVGGLRAATNVIPTGFSIGVSRGTPAVAITEPTTGLDFQGNLGSSGASSHVCFAWNASRTGVTPFNKLNATYIWRLFPRVQDGYWSCLFHSRYWGSGQFDVSNQYYGMHPYPTTPTCWEISAGSNDNLGPVIPNPAGYNRWYTQVAIAHPDSFLEYYYDWDAGLSMNFQDETRVQTDSAIIVGDAPWNPGFEIVNGIMRGFQYYDTTLTLAQIAQEIATPGSFRTPWYLRMNPTVVAGGALSGAGIEDQSGNGHHPKWMTANRPLQYTA